MSRPLVYRTQTRDAATRLPVVVIDSTALPADRLPDPATEVPQHLGELPDSAFVVVFLASRAPRAPNLAWIRRVHAMLDRELKKRIVRVYVVHAKWYTRALNRAIGPVVSPKFSRKVEHVRDLAELSRYLDITAIDFSPQVFIDDMARSEANDGGEIPVPRLCNSIFGEPLTHAPTAYWRAALIYLHSARVDASVFLPAARARDADADLATVLISAVKREQRLRLADYGPYAVLAALKEYLLCLPAPLIDLHSLALPVQDSAAYSSRVVAPLQGPAFLHLDQLISWAKTTTQTRDAAPPGAAVPPGDAARSLGPAIFGLYNPSREQHAVAARVTRTLIEHWPLQAGEARKSMAPRDVSNELPRRAPPTKPPLLPPRTHVVTEARVGVVDGGGKMPREYPSEVSAPPPRYCAPNRRAFGRVAEIMKKYDESHYM